MNNINALVVGGNWTNNDTRKQSGVINKISKALDQSAVFKNTVVINGGSLQDFTRVIKKPDDTIKVLTEDLIIWMPNIENEVEKYYPTKKNGSILICSKVMREGYTQVDAVSRIFKMHGNAVIAIYKYMNDGEITCVFQLIDALNNVWYEGKDISELVKRIIDFYNFTKATIRAKTINYGEQSELLTTYKSELLSSKEYHTKVIQLIDYNNRLASFIQTSCGQRFFGNISTRCSKLFPTTRINNEIIAVSPRNSNKEKLESTDMILYREGYISELGLKPSVDAPIQLELYKSFPNINFMIHGHAMIKNAPITHEYRLCGDLNEVHEVSKLLIENKEMILNGYGTINLKNHGFLIFADTLAHLENVIFDLIERKAFTYDKENYL